MACKNCKNWYSPERDEDWSFKPKQAFCVLYPAWVSTDEHHFCSQQESKWPQLEWEIDRAREGYIAQRRRETEQRERAIKAEKALKAARAKLRENGLKP